ncbi:MAG: T9SS type A sorting domain-containing protein [bacterium]
MKIFRILFVLVLIFSNINLFSETKGTQLQRNTYGVFDLQKNQLSNVSFYSTNYGIYCLNVSLLETQNAGGCYWPWSSVYQYVFASGFWFGAQKINPATNKLTKYVVYSLDPESGTGLYVPGRIEDGDTAITSYKKKYRIYFSFDFNKNTGTPYISIDGPNWPLWKNTSEKKMPFSSENYNYVNDENNRNIESNTNGPLFISDEDIISVFKDTDLSKYPAGVSESKALGYPLKTEVESHIYTWQEPSELQDIVVFSFTLRNLSSDTLKNCWFGQVNDIDIARSPYTAIGAQNDRIRYCKEKPDLNLFYGWTGLDKGEQGGDFGYIGFSLLESPSIDSKGFIKKNKLLFPQKDQIGLKSARGWVLGNDLKTDSARYQFLSEKKFEEDNGAGDKRMLLSVGSFNLRPWEECRFAFAMILAMPINQLKYDGSIADIATLLQKAQLIKDEYYKGVSAIRSEGKLRAASTIQVYPNPAQDYINLEATGAEFQIYNINGKSVLSGTDTGKIDISGLESGLYLVLSNEKYYKFVKE